MAELFVVSTIDWPSDWYVVGIASSKEKRRGVAPRTESRLN